MWTTQGCAIGSNICDTKEAGTSLITQDPESRLPTLNSLTVSRDQGMSALRDALHSSDLEPGWLWGRGTGLGFHKEPQEN